MYKNYKQPPEVIQYHRPKNNYLEIAEAAAKNAGVGKPHTRLFLLYANCSTGFRPALAHVTNSTDINEKNISGYRSGLTQAGLITYTEDKDKVVIDWDIVSQIAKTKNYVYKYTEKRPLLSKICPSKKKYPLRDPYI